MGPSYLFFVFGIMGPLVSHNGYWITSHWPVSSRVALMWI